MYLQLQKPNPAELQDDDALNIAVPRALSSTFCILFTYLAPPTVCSNSGEGTTVYSDGGVVSEGNQVQRRRSTHRSGFGGFASISVSELIANLRLLPFPSQSFYAMQSNISTILQFLWCRTTLLPLIGKYLISSYDGLN